MVPCFLGCLPLDKLCIPHPRLELCPLFHVWFPQPRTGLGDDEGERQIADSHLRSGGGTRNVYTCAAVTQVALSFVKAI